MSEQQVHAAIVRVIQHRLDECGAVTRDDMRRAGIPDAAITRRFKPILLEVLEQRRIAGIKV